MRISDVMASNPATITPDTDLRLARNMMVWANVRYLPVVSKDGELVGMLSQGDVIRVLRWKRVPETVEGAMAKNVHWITAGATTDEAIERFEIESIGCLPVVDDGEVIGLVTRAELLRADLEDSMPGSSQLMTADVMTPDPAVVRSDDSLMTAIDRMRSRGVRHLPVIDGDRKVLGIISDRDVRACVGDPVRAVARDIEHLKVGAVMTRDPIMARVDDSAATVAQTFANRRLSAVPVIDSSGALAGIVSYIDLLRAH